MANTCVATPSARRFVGGRKRPRSGSDGAFSRLIFASFVCDLLSGSRLRTWVGFFASGSALNCRFRGGSASTYPTTSHRPWPSTRETGVLLRGPHGYRTRVVCAASPGGNDDAAGGGSGVGETINGSRAAGEVRGGGGPTTVSKARRLELQMRKAAGMRGRWREAIELFDEMQLQGHAISPDAFAAALRACAKGGDGRRACELFDAYEEAGFFPPAPGIVSAAVKACCRAGRVADAVAILARGLDAGVVPEPALCSAVYQSCALAGEWPAVLELSARTAAAGVIPDAEGHRLLITAHVARQEWADATRALVRMGAAGHVPSGRDTRHWRLVSNVLEELGEDPDDDGDDDGFGGGGGGSFNKGAGGAFGGAAAGGGSAFGGGEALVAAIAAAAGAGAVVGAGGALNGVDSGGVTGCDGGGGGGDRSG